MKSKLSKEELTIAEERRNRLIYLRKILKLTQKDLEGRHGISVKSLQNWETIRHAGLTEKGAKKLLDAFRAEGLESSIQWLMYGTGKEPLLLTEQFGQKPLSDIDPHFKKHFVLNKEEKMIESIQEELKIFYKWHPTAIDSIIIDDGLAPCFLPGDHVAGEKLFDNDIDRAIGLPCIIQITPGSIIHRQLCRSKKTEYYTLHCTNPETSIKEKVIREVKPLFAAPIIWMRRCLLNNADKK